MSAPPRFRGAQTGPATVTLLVLAAIVLCFARPAVATIPEPPADPFFGIVVQQDALSDREISKMQRGAVGTVRFVVPWQRVEPTQGSYEFGSVDTQIAEIERAGATPLPVLYGQPGWLGDPRQAPLHSDASRSAWQSLLMELAGRYGNAGTLAQEDPGFRPVEAWQVWNEPNLPSFWTGEQPNAAGYVDLLQLSAPALRAADPEAEVIGAGLSPAPKGVPPRRYLRHMYGEYERLGVAPDFDQVALNPYAPRVRDTRKQVGKFARLAAELAPGPPPGLLIAEVGWTSSGPKKQLVAGNRKTQAKRLRRVYRLLRNKRNRWRISAVLWYAWRDLPAGSNGCVFCEHIGLFDSDLGAKPAWKAFRDMRR